MAIVVTTGAKAPQLSPQEQQERRRQRRTYIIGGFTILALLFVLLLRVLAFEAVVITSGSMQPTLYRGDYTLVDHRVALRGSWGRGDVIIFEAPATWKGPGTSLVKRIVALPGEEVTLLNGQVLIDNKVLDETYLTERPDPEDSQRLRLGPDQYFVLGDNRNNSDDSSENGPIAESDIRGKLKGILWPSSRFGGL